MDGPRWAPDIFTYEAKARPLRSWPEVRSDMAKITGTIHRGGRILFFAGVLLYLAAVWLTGSLLVAVAGGLVFVAWIAHDVETAVSVHTVMVLELMGEAIAHTQVTLVRGLHAVELAAAGAAADDDFSDLPHDDE